MVHYVPEPEMQASLYGPYRPVSTSVATRDYWKISTEQPEDHDARKYLDSVWHRTHTIEDVKRRRGRYNRNLLIYETCTEKELRRFCRLRGLKWRAPRGVEKYDNRTLWLRTNLETDDENWSFEKFLDFPAELRVLIYERLFDSYQLSKKHEMPPPPIAQVSQLLRKESLPVFYANPPTALGLCSHLRPLTGGNEHFLKLVNFLQFSGNIGVVVIITLASVEVKPLPKYRSNPQPVSLKLMQQRAEAFLAVLQKRAGSPKLFGSLGLEQGDAETLREIFNSDEATTSV